MPLPDYITTSNTFGNWLDATNNVISHIGNTSAYLILGETTTGNISLNGTMTLVNSSSASIGNSTVNTVITSTDVTINGVSIFSPVISMVAGETLAERDVVYIEPTLTAGTAGRAYLMDADGFVGNTEAYFAGFALASVSAGQTVLIQRAGIVGGFSGLTAGAIYYVNSTPGTITSTKPLPSPFGKAFPVGIAINSTAILINTGHRQEEYRTVVYGYALGGWTGAVVATADRITFSTSTTAAHTPANLSQARSDVAGLSDGSVYGYALGGWTGNRVVTADRITFSTSITAAHTPANLSQSRSGPAGLSDGAVYGYAVGGSTAGTGFVTTADRITFSTSTTAAHTPANLSQGRYYLAGLSDGAVYGYAVGGWTASGFVTTADRITFSTSTTAAHTPANLSQAREGPAGLSDSSVYGYAVGGNTGAAVATADRITFSTSTTAAHTPANLSQARFYPTGLSDSSVYGYTVGGSTGAYVVTADRITFSTSITAAHTPANLSRGRHGLAGLSFGAV